MTVALIASALIMSAASLAAPKVGYQLPGFEICKQNGGDNRCPVHLDDREFLIDSSNGNPAFLKAEAQDAFTDTLLYKSGDNLIIESSNSSASKNWSVVVFSYRDGVARATNYISLSRSITQDGPKWSGQSCQGDVLLNKNTSIFSAAFDALCDGKISQNAKVVPKTAASKVAANAGLLVTIPNYEVNKKSWSEATYVFVSNDSPFASSLLCVAGCDGDRHHVHLGGWIDRSIWIDMDVTEKKDGAVEGEYFYTKRNIKILIKGVLSQDNIDISEFADSTDVSSAKFEGKRYEDSYVGIWKSRDKKYNFFLAKRLY